MMRECPSKTLTESHFDGGQAPSPTKLQAPPPRDIVSIGSSPSLLGERPVERHADLSKRSQSKREDDHVAALAQQLGGVCHPSESALPCEPPEAHPDARHKLNYAKHQRDHGQAARYPRKHSLSPPTLSPTSSGPNRPPVNQGLRAATRPNELPVEGSCLLATITAQRKP